MKWNLCCVVCPDPSSWQPKHPSPQLLGVLVWWPSAKSLSRGCPGKASQRKPLCPRPHGNPGVSSHPVSTQGESIKLGSLNARKDNSEGQTQPRVAHGSAWVCHLTPLSNPTSFPLRQALIGGHSPVDLLHINCLQVCLLGNPLTYEV